MVPKLVAQDVPLLRSLLSGVFPGADIVSVDEKLLEDEIRKLCQVRHLLPRPTWLNKVLQLYQIQKLNHGVMLVGPVGTGKSAAWRVLLDSMERIDGVKGASYVLDPKAVAKEQLYGKLDATTLEWTDGVFTALLRKILYNVHGESSKRHWIIFDGDVDPEWAENLNSVLDDNKLLTLPNGERLQIPGNVRLIFEVDTLKFATLATVSRCGMVWFSDDVVEEDMIFSNFLNYTKLGDIGQKGSTVERKSSRNLEEAEGEGEGEASKEEEVKTKKGTNFGGSGVSEALMRVRVKVAEALAPAHESGGFVSKCLMKVQQYEHIMPLTKVRALESLYSLMRKGINMIAEYNEMRQDMPMSDAHLEKFITKWLVVGLCWGLGGSLCLKSRLQLCREIAAACTIIPLPDGLDDNTSLLDFEVRIDDGEWHHWKEAVPSIDIEHHQLENANLVVETVDTIRHRTVLAAWLEEKKPFILCGPPGSGKTMTLTSTLKGLTDFDIASLNFSSGSTPELLLKTFDHYCEYVKTTNGVILRPAQPGKWLIVFCDECNLPKPDKYDTQHVIMFIRQITEAGGFWKTDNTGVWNWVRTERIQFAGACNPPTDAGRHPMSDRFLRHAPLMFVDFPGSVSLRMIYGTFNRALLRPIQNLRTAGDALTDAMVDFYTASQGHFTAEMQPHYIYSPRELTRWKLALYEALDGLDFIELRDLTRLLVHEALRIFQDRLVEVEEKQWTDDQINTIVAKAFAPVGFQPTDIDRPILFSSYMGQKYQEAEREELRDMIRGKLRVFNEEELNVQLVLFDQVLDHVTRIDRVLRQPLGHLLLVGASGAGKTILSRFVSWLNGLSVFVIKAGRNYDTTAFEADLRVVMKRSGIKGEKITFIFDESNALGPAFLERMNALLASGEVPGLFEADEYIALMAECRGAYGSNVGSEDADLFSKFTKQVQRNLHIVFTMNPANPDFSNRGATSPALFNRCVTDWFGDWPHDALVQVALEFTETLEVAQETFTNPIGDEGLRRQTLASTIVDLHESVAEMNDKLKRAGKKYNYVTPRDFLDFIRHFMKTVDEKKSEVVENTKHLTVGLTKLHETEEQVAQLQIDLAQKDISLQAKNKQAEEKMQLMVVQQSEAEEKKKEAEIMSGKLAIQVEEISVQTLKVQTELDEVQPLLTEAQAMVGSIPKRSLDELKALASPPGGVKMALQACVVMLNDAGSSEVTWDEARKVLKSHDFVNRIMGFTIDGVGPKTVAQLKSKYIGNPDWDVDAIDRASKAAGPLAKWAQASLTCQMINLKVDPLKHEIDTLEKDRSKNAKDLEATTKLIETLESKLAELKNDYAILITEVQLIKTEMETVQHKVQRSQDLLANLQSEKIRWSDTCEKSREAIFSLTGDSLLAGAFSTYMGFFEHSDRRRLFRVWYDALETVGMRYLPGISLVEFLSKPSERFQWQKHALPADDLSLENAVILKHFIRYPLIIDPSGQATTFLVNEFQNKKLLKTSFVDPSFMKSLESSLRFGTPLLVQDVDKVDPILNSVLNQETHKQGGRVLITVGEADIDFSPAFTMFLTTRDPTMQFTPDLCSRVTFVNFTLTPSSLQNQCLSSVLKSERPDVDKKRSDMLKLQGEFRVKVRELEDSLLMALSNVQGNILDDDKVIGTLENLKKQAAEVEREVAKTDIVMEEVNKTSKEYEPLAIASARIFFTLQHLCSIFFLYHFDLNFFENVFHDSLKDETRLSKAPEGDYAVRRELLFQVLFRNTYQACARGLRDADRLTLALQLARTRVEVEYEVPLGGVELEALLHGAVAHDSSAKPPKPSQQVKEMLNIQQLRSVAELHGLPVFKNLFGHVDSNSSAWIDYLKDAAPESKIPAGAVSKGDEGEDEGGLLKVRQLIHEALLIKATRPDRLPIVLTSLVESCLEPQFLWVEEYSIQELTHFVNNKVKATVPIVFVSAPGFDPSGKVVNAAAESGTHLNSVAMGSEEGFVMADKAITNASRQGTWVLLKNVHLAAVWLLQLEKRIYKMVPHEKFRIFLTMEFNEKVPKNILRLSYTFVFEPPAGIKASMLRSYASILTRKRSERAPVEARCRLHFLLAFLHSIILERKRYLPVGWTKGYEFSDADQNCATTILDEWLDEASVKGGQVLDKVDPKNIPWYAIQTLVNDVAYGGRLDNDVDRRVLRSFIGRLFNETSFQEDFCLSLTPEELGIPNSEVPALYPPPVGNSRDHYFTWVEKLPNVDLPTWIGFAPNAERLLGSRLGEGTLINWSTLNSKSAEDLHELLPITAVEEAAAESGLQRSNTKEASKVAIGWLAELLPHLRTMQQQLPPKSFCPKLVRTAEAVNDPLFRCFEREVNTGKQLLETIRQDLTDLEQLCLGEIKSTNYMREVARCLSRQEVPKPWIKYRYYEVLSATAWLSDFVERVTQLAMIASKSFGQPAASYSDNDMKLKMEAVSTGVLFRMSKEGKREVNNRNIFFGGLFFSTAFITATQQAVAQKFGWSLDDLTLTMDVGDTTEDGQSFSIGGMVIEGAKWDEKAKCLATTDIPVSRLPITRMKWVRQDEYAQRDKSVASIPLFLNKARNMYIRMIEMPISKDVPVRVWYERGVAIMLWSES
eukprot:GHVN01019032.1.p1 GENE.GHVN01019032.1~~GHVN01019032.1.p1  ORF type:complete len:2863 (-),score=448.94 GHVN01019032.1:301-8082(-)